MNIIQGGSEAFDALLYPSTFNVDYFENQWKNAPKSVSPIGDIFMQNAKNLMYENMNSESTRIARNALTMASIDRYGYIMEYVTIEQCQTASIYMQRWLMAEPNIKEAYLKQRIDGYSETYSPITKYFGEEDYDYRRVMDGVGFECSKEGWIVKHYGEDLLDNDRVLEHDEKLILINTWDLMVGFLNASRDPTDVYNKL